MGSPSYVSTPDVILLYTAPLFNRKSCKLKQMITYLFSQKNPKNIQYLHTQVHYIQFPYKATLNVIIFLKMSTNFHNRHGKAAQNIVHSRRDSMKSNILPVK